MASSSIKSMSGKYQAASAYLNRQEAHLRGNSNGNAVIDDEQPTQRLSSLSPSNGDKRRISIPRFELQPAGKEENTTMVRVNAMTTSTKSSIDNLLNRHQSSEQTAEKQAVSLKHGNGGRQVEKHRHKTMLKVMDPNVHQIMPVRRHNRG